MNNNEEEINRIAVSLENSPDFLSNLIKEFSSAELKKRRIENKWSAHEHACHVCVGEKYSFHPRYAKFMNEKNPIIKPISGNDFENDFYYNLKLEDAMDEFRILRNRTVELIRNSPAAFFQLQAQHPEYSTYTPRIMVQHLLMHDYWHFYRIEELLLCKDGFIE